MSRLGLTGLTAARRSRGQALTPVPSPRFKDADDDLRNSMRAGVIQNVESGFEVAFNGDAADVTVFAATALPFRLDLVERAGLRPSFGAAIEAGGLVPLATAIPATSVASA